MVWEYQAFGNGAIVVEMLNGVKGIVGTGEYTTLIALLALGSFFYLVPTKALAGKIHETLMYFIVIVIGMQLIFGSTMDLRVVDRLGASPAVVATDIPIGIGVPLAAINGIGWEITTWYETNMASTVPLGLKLSEGAPFSAGSRLLKDMQEVRIVDGEISSYLNNYIRDCKLPDVMEDPSTYAKWFQDPDLLEQMKSTNAVRFTKRHDNEVISCKDASTEIVNLFSIPASGSISNTFATWKGKLGLSGGNSVSALQGSASSILSNAQVIDSITSSISGGGFTSNQFFIGNLLTPQINNALENSAVLTGSDPVLASMNIQQGRKAQSAGWMTAAILFQDMAGYLFSALNLLVIGLSPIIILGIFIPKFGTKVVSSFIKVLVWLALWWPGLALVNHISTSFMLSQVVGENMLDFATTMPWENFGADMLSSYGANATMASGFLATVIPMIMWSLITGSGQAFTAALQGASGRAEAQAAAKNISTGSFEEGNIRYNNIGSNKNDTANYVNSGDMGHNKNVVQDNGLVVTNHYAGQNTKHGGVDVTAKKELTRAISESDAVADMAVVNTTASSGINSASQGIIADSKNIISALSKSEGSGSRESVEQAEQVSSASTEALLIGHEANYSKATIDESTDALTATIGAKLDLGVGSALKAVKNLISGGKKGSSGADMKMLQEDAESKLEQKRIKDGTNSPEQAASDSATIGGLSAYLQGQYSWQGKNTDRTTQGTSENVTENNGASTIEQELAANKESFDRMSAVLANLSSSNGISDTLQNSITDMAGVMTAASLGYSQTETLLNTTSVKTTVSYNADANEGSVPKRIEEVDWAGNDMNNAHKNLEAIVEADTVAAFNKAETEVEQGKAKVEEGGGVVLEAEASVVAAATRTVNYHSEEMDKRRVSVDTNSSEAILSHKANHELLKNGTELDELKPISFPIDGGNRELDLTPNGAVNLIIDGKEQAVITYASSSEGESGVDHYGTLAMVPSDDGESLKLLRVHGEEFGENYESIKDRNTPNNTVFSGQFERLQGSLGGDTRTHLAGGEVSEFGKLALSSIENDDSINNATEWIRSHDELIEGYNSGIPSAEYTNEKHLGVFLVGEIDTNNGAMEIFDRGVGDETPATSTFIAETGDVLLHNSFGQADSPAGENPSQFDWARRFEIPNAVDR